MDWTRVQALMTLRDSGHTIEALKELEMMAESNSDKNEKASLLLTQITCHLLLGKLDDAERTLRRVKTLAPDNAEVRLNFDQQEAYFLIARGDVSEGLHKLDHLLKRHQYIEHDPSYRYLWEDIQQRRAFALVDLGRPMEALPLLKEAVSFALDEPRDVQLVNLYLGTCHYELGQYDLAKEQFLKVIQLDQDNELQAEARYRLAAIYFREGALAQAKLQLEEVVSVFGTRSEPKRHRKGIYELISKTCHHLGEEDSARTYEERAEGI